MPKFFAKKYDEFVERNVKDVLTSAGDGVEAGLQDPYAPAVFNRTVSSIFNEVWDEIQDELEESICSGITYGDKSDKMFREFSLIGWPDTPPPAWPPSFKWLRAKLLYALLPADSTLFKKLRDPVGASVFLLNCWNPYQISVWIFVLLFVLIDKRDEFQLVNFILTFKGFQAVSALLAAHGASMQLFSCAVGGDEPPQLLKNASFARAAEWGAPVDKCAAGAPGTDEDFYYLCLVEPVRLLVVWLAFGLLASGYAKGGKEEILALEQVRLDAADGTLDGVVDHSKLRRDEKERDKGLKSQVLAHHTDAQLEEALAYARARIGARSCVGGVLPYFLAYDLLAALYCVYTYSSIIAANGFAPNGLFGAKPWQYWVTLFFMKQAYALLAALHADSGILAGPPLATAASPEGRHVSGLRTAHRAQQGPCRCRAVALASGGRGAATGPLQQRRRCLTFRAQAFPFLVFSIPLVGQGLHEAKFTGYDMRGKLCASLGRASVIHLYNQRREREQKREEHRRDEQKRAREKKRAGDGFSLFDRFGSDEVAGVLRVRVIRGANLPAIDKDGKSDPYVVLHSGGKKAKTKVQKNTTSPTWDETLELKVVDATAPVHVKVWDFDTLGTNDLIAEGAFRLEQCEGGAPTPIVVQLGEKRGSVDLEVTWTPAGAGDSASVGGTEPANGGASQRGGSSSSNRFVGEARVLVKGGAGLPAADKDGKSDPYVVLHSGGKKAKTKVQKNTTSPTWDETLELKVVDRSDPLVVKVWDSDTLGMNDCLGEGRIALAECAANEATPLTVQLEGGKGSISVEVTWCPYPNAEGPAAPSSVEEGASEPTAAVSKAPPAPLVRKLSLDQRLKASMATLVKRPVAGTATVLVLRATGLPAADKGGKSDAYVVVQAGGGKKKRTKVQRGTLNPVWTETLEAEEELSLKVWDKDRLGMDDLLGQGVLALAECPAHARTPHAVALGEAGAVVNVEVTWRPNEDKDKSA